MLKRFLALFLAMTMVFTMLPTAAIAEDFEDEPILSEETERPEEETGPEEPEETEPETTSEETEPEETEPEETEIPEESEPEAEPEETEEPEDSEEPEETELPEEEDGDEPADAIVASGTCGENLTWKLDDKGTLTISGTGAMYGWLSWYGNSSVKAVVIEDGVTSIGSSAFSHCSSLTNITIPDSVTSVGDCAFVGCSSLTSVRIGSGVTSIGSEAFFDCSSLTSVTIPDSVTSIGSDAFYNCGNVERLYISSIESWLKVSLGDCYSNPLGDAYSVQSKVYVDNVLLEHLEIPTGTTAVKCNAFAGWDSITSVTIPDSVTIIDSSAFGCENVEKLYISSIESWLKIKHGGRGTNPLASSAFDNDNYSKTDAKVYVNGTLLKRLVIPEGVTAIPADVFANWDSVETVSIPNSVTSIGAKAFEGCDGIKMISIPDSVTSIGSEAFWYCSSLKSITIPGSVTKISVEAFMCCSSLANVSIGNGVTSIDNMAFLGCSNLTSVTIPDSVTRIGYYAFWYCGSLASVRVGKGVRHIGFGAFGLNTKLKKIYFTGDAPEFEISVGYIDEAGDEEVYPFYRVTATAYYPCGNPTWTEDVRQDYGGKLTWVAEHQYADGVCTGCGKTNMFSLSGPEMLRGGASGTFKAKTTSKATVLWKLRPQDMAFASITTAGKLTTKAVAEPVEIVLTAYLKSNPDVSMDYAVTLVPGAEEIRLFSPEGNSENGVFSLDLRESDEMQLCAAILPGDAFRSGTWKSSSAKIASVNAEGLVTFKKPGTVTITFTASDGSNKKASVKICAGTPAEGLHIIGAEALTSGGKATLKAEFTNFPTVKTVTWVSSDPAVAAVNAKGVVTARAVYEETPVTITAIANDGSGLRAEHILTVQPKANVLPIRQDGKIVNSRTVYLDLNGGSTVLWAPEGAQWKSSAPGVATVEDGVVTIKGTGTASITAVSADGTQTGKVAVKISTLVRRMEIIAPNDEPLISGKGKVTLKANVNADAALKTVTWASSDPTVATVSTAGVVTAKSGVRYNTEVTITATAKDGSGIHDEITLTVIPAAKLVNIVSEEALTTADGLFIAAGEVLNGRTIVLPAGTDFRLGAVVYPDSEEAGARQDVTWSFSAKGYIGTSPDGTMTALKPGAVTITVKTADGKSNTVKLKIV